MAFDLDTFGDEEDDSPFPEVRASVSNIDDPEMPAMTIRMWFIGLTLCLISAYVLPHVQGPLSPDILSQGTERVLYLPITSTVGSASRPRPDLVPYWEILGFRRPNQDLPATEMARWTGIFSQPRTLEHQGTCAGVHYGQRCCYPSLRLERHCGPSNLLWRFLWFRF